MQLMKTHEALDHWTAIRKIVIQKLLEIQIGIIEFLTSE